MQKVLSKRFGFGFLAFASAFLLTSCSSDTEFGRIGMPEPATEEAPRILSLWQGSWIASMFVGVLVWALLAWAIIAYRRKDGDGLPEQTKYHVPLEIMYTVIPLIMILALFWFTARDQKILTENPGDQKHTVNVQGWRWSWGFNYIEEDAYDVGTPGDRPILWLPVDEKVKFTLTSQDVIHSFWIPAFLTKMDIIPGQLNELTVTPNKLGVFPGKCAELCGTDHSRMIFDVKVVTRAEFDAHIADLKARGQSGIIDTGRATVAGEGE
jgi:cytochrome c oxidase subunit 2